MIAYNKIWLYNLRLLEVIDEAMEDACITGEEHKRISDLHPVKFYTPNFFVRIGLFILTVICMSFMLSFFLMIMSHSLQTGYKAMMIIQGLVCYGALEFFAREKNHFRSGVDDALLWMAGGMVISGICLALDADPVVTSFIVLIISLYLTLRFADRLAMLVCCGAFAAFIFYLCNRGGDTIKAIVPFVMMAAATGLYIIVKQLKKKISFELYDDCLLVAEIFSLSLFYAAGNYFVVRELSNLVFNLQLQPGQSIPLGILFKMLTAAVPVVYLVFGVKRKDAWMLRVGLFALAASVLTYKFYDDRISIEAALSVAGAVCIIAAWYFLRLLKVPRNGFAFTARPKPGIDWFRQAESLVIAETFGGKDIAPQEDTKFGGGSFGGGGAGDTF